MRHLVGSGEDRSIVRGIELLPGDINLLVQRNTKRVTIPDRLPVVESHVRTIFARTSHARRWRN